MPPEDKEYRLGVHLEGLKAEAQALGAKNEESKELQDIEKECMALSEKSLEVK